jgi:Ca2+-binding EF-hand superfamily protein
MNKPVWSLMLAAALLVAGSLSAAPQESKEAEKIFATLDTDQDGKLNQAEFEQFLDAQAETEVTAQEKQDEFKAWDSNGDGWISQGEFTTNLGQ